jgi:hypothetical protein
MKITANKVTIKGSEDLTNLGVSLTVTSKTAEKPVENSTVEIDTGKLTEEQQKTVSDFLALFEPKSE